MKEEALKLADELEKPVPVPNQPDMIYIDGHRMYGAQMIRRLVEELDKQGEPYVWHMKSNDPDLVKDYWYFIEKPSRESKISHQAIPLYTTPQTKPLSDDEIVNLLKNVNLFDMKAVARAIEERHGIR